MFYWFLIADVIAFSWKKVSTTQKDQNSYLRIKG